MKFYFLVLLIISLIVINSSFADSYIVCESSKSRRQYCDLYRAAYSDIYVSRQYSDSPCIEGVSWGRTERGIWVDNGCRAQFGVRDSRGGYHGGISGPYDRRPYDRPYGEDRYDYEKQKQIELQREIDKAKELNRQLELEKSKGWNPPQPERCPAGFEPGNHRCSNEERRRGCKDMRMPGGTTCNSRGWGSR